MFKDLKEELRGILRIEAGYSYVMIKCFIILLTAIERLHANRKN